MKRERPWLLTVHCVNHRIELAVKEAFTAEPIFDEVEEFYIAIFYYLKNSGAVKAQVKEAAETLDITNYVLPKITGTRFVAHRKRGYQKFVHMWPALIVAFENSKAETKVSAKKAKLEGYLRKLRSIRMLFKFAANLDLLEKVVPSSMVFEGEGLMAYEVSSTVNMTIVELGDLIADCENDVVPIDSYLRYFNINVDETTNAISISRDYVKSGHELRNPANQENIFVEVEDMVGTPGSEGPSLAAMLRVSSNLKDILIKRFEDFDQDVYQNMRWFDPKLWNDDKDYGVKQLEYLYHHFQLPLDHQGFNIINAVKEWKNVKVLVRNMYAESTARSLWQQMLKYRSKEYPNICLLASMVMSISGSNSSVERAFSTLTLILSDRRLSLHHEKLENIMLIKGNDKNWTVLEKKTIINNAVGNFLQKRRKALLDEIDDEVVLGEENMGEGENVGESDGESDSYSSGDNDCEISDTVDEY